MIFLQINCDIIKEINEMGGKMLYNLKKYNIKARHLIYFKTHLLNLIFYNLWLFTIIQSMNIDVTIFVL